MLVDTAALAAHPFMPIEPMPTQGHIYQRLAVALGHHSLTLELGAAGLEEFLGDEPLYSGHQVVQALTEGLRSARHHEINTEMLLAAIALWGLLELPTAEQRGGLFELLELCLSLVDQRYAD